MEDKVEHEPEHETHATPKIDLSKALHEAGHEVEELGFEGVPDTGPVIHAAEQHSEGDVDRAIDAAALGAD